MKSRKLRIADVLSPHPFQSLLILIGILQEHSARPASRQSNRETKSRYDVWKKKYVEIQRADRWVGIVEKGLIKFFERKYVAPLLENKTLEPLSKEALTKEIDALYESIHPYLKDENRKAEFEGEALLGVYEYAIIYLGALNAEVLNASFEEQGVYLEKLFEITDALHQYCIDFYRLKKNPTENDKNKEIRWQNQQSYLRETKRFNVLIAEKQFQSNHALNPALFDLKHYALKKTFLTSFNTVLVGFYRNIDDRRQQYNYLFRVGMLVDFDEELSYFSSDILVQLSDFTFYHQLGLYLDIKFFNFEVLILFLQKFSEAFSEFYEKSIKENDANEMHCNFSLYEACRLTMMMYDFFQKLYLQSKPYFDKLLSEEMKTLLIKETYYQNAKAYVQNIEKNDRPVLQELISKYSTSWIEMISKVQETNDYSNVIDIFLHFKYIEATYGPYLASVSLGPYLEVGRVICMYLSALYKRSKRKNEKPSLFEYADDIDLSKIESLPNASMDNVFLKQLLAILNALHQKLISFMKEDYTVYLRDTEKASYRNPNLFFEKFKKLNNLPDFSVDIPEEIKTQLSLVDIQLESAVGMLKYLSDHAGKNDPQHIQTLSSTNGKIRCLIDNITKVLKPDDKSIFDKVNASLMPLKLAVDVLGGLIFMIEYKSQVEQGSLEKIKSIFESWDIQAVKRWLMKNPAEYTHHANTSALLTYFPQMLYDLLYLLSDRLIMDQFDGFEEKKNLPQELWIFKLKEFFEFLFALHWLSGVVSSALQKKLKDRQKVLLGIIDGFDAVVENRQYVAEIEVINQAISELRTKKWNANDKLPKTFLETLNNFEDFLEKSKHLNGETKSFQQSMVYCRLYSVVGNVCYAEKFIGSMVSFLDFFVAANKQINMPLENINDFLLLLHDFLHYLDEIDFEKVSFDGDLSQYRTVALEAFDAVYAIKIVRKEVKDEPKKKLTRKEVKEDEPKKKLTLQPIERARLVAFYYKIAFECPIELNDVGGLKQMTLTERERLVFCEKLTSLVNGFRKDLDSHPVLFFEEKLFLLLMTLYLDLYKVQYGFDDIFENIKAFDPSIWSDFLDQIDSLSLEGVDEFGLGLFRLGHFNVIFELLNFFGSFFSETRENLKLLELDDVDDVVFLEKLLEFLKIAKRVCQFKLINRIFDKKSIQESIKEISECNKEIKARLLVLHSQKDAPKKMTHSSKKNRNATANNKKEASLAPVILPQEKSFTRSKKSSVLPFFMRVSREERATVYDEKPSDLPDTNSVVSKTVENHENRLTLPDSVLTVCDLLGDCAYIVGSAVRDPLPRNYNIVVKGLTQQAISEKLSSFHGQWQGKNPPAFALTVDGCVVQITLMIGNDLEQDALQRNYTCNAHYYHPATETFHPFRGSDIAIEQKQIVPIGDLSNSLQADPMRIFHALQLMASGYVFEEALFKTFSNQLYLLLELNKNRMNLAVSRCFSEKYADKMPRYFKKFNLLFLLFGYTEKESTWCLDKISMIVADKKYQSAEYLWMFLRIPAFIQFVLSDRINLEENINLYTLQALNKKFGIFSESPVDAMTVILLSIKLTCSEDDFSRLLKAVNTLTQKRYEEVALLLTEKDITLFKEAFPKASDIFSSQLKNYFANQEKSVMSAPIKFFDADASVLIGSAGSNGQGLPQPGGK